MGGGGGTVSGNTETGVAAVAASQSAPAAAPAVRAVLVGAPAATAPSSVRDTGGQVGGGVFLEGVCGVREEAGGDRMGVVI